MIQINSLQDLTLLTELSRGDIDAISLVRPRNGTHSLYVVKRFEDRTGTADLRFQRELFLHTQLPKYDLSPGIAWVDEETKTFVMPYFYHVAADSIGALLCQTPKMAEALATLHSLDLNPPMPLYSHSSTITGAGRKEATLKVLEKIGIHAPQILKEMPWLSRAIETFADKFESEEFDSDRVSLIHGDAHYFNLLIGKNETKALIDHGRSRLANGAYDNGQFIYRATNGQFSKPSNLMELALLSRFIPAYSERANLDENLVLEQAWGYSIFSIITELPWVLWEWKNIDPNREPISVGIAKNNLEKLCKEWQHSYEAPKLKNIKSANVSEVKEVKPDYAIATICHKPYIKYLEKHLESIAAAQGDREVPIYLMVSQVEKKDHSLVEKIVDKFKDKLKIEMFYDQRPLTIGQSRNTLWDRTGSDWTLFFDCDTSLHPDYFDELERVLLSYANDKNVKAIAGGIGIENATMWGMYEGYLDLFAYIGKLSWLGQSLYDSVMADFDFPRDPTSTIQLDFYKRIMDYLKQYEGIPITYLQGFNQILHRDIKTELKGFDDSFWSAEDREMAAKVRASGNQVIFAPTVMMLHNYEFTLKQIMKRKWTHGIWSEKFRHKYVDRPDVVSQYDAKRWLNYAKTVLNPPEPFNHSWASRLHYAAGFISYAASGIIEHMRSK